MTCKSPDDELTCQQKDLQKYVRIQSGPQVTQSFKVSRSCSKLTGGGASLVLLHFVELGKRLHSYIRHIYFNWILCQPTVTMHLYSFPVMIAHTCFELNLFMPTLLSQTWNPERSNR